MLPGGPPGEQDKEDTIHLRSIRGIVLIVERCSILPVRPRETATVAQVK